MMDNDFNPKPFEHALSETMDTPEQTPVLIDQEETTDLAIDTSDDVPSAAPDERDPVEMPFAAPDERDPVEIPCADSDEPDPVEMPSAAPDDCEPAGEKEASAPIDFAMGGFSADQLSGPEREHTAMSRANQPLYGAAVLRQDDQEELAETVEPTVIPAMDRVRIARDRTRLMTSDYIDHLITGFLELGGDRLRGNDPAVIAGVGWLGNIPITVAGHQKGKTPAEMEACRHGMANPEGYRKFLRLIRQAEKFGRPVLTFVDTPGAFCGVEAEENGQAAAIAECLKTLSGLCVPTLAIVIGEGGSGGALAFSVTDEIWMCENSIYSILSPEGFARFWKDARRASEAVPN